MSQVMKNIVSARTRGLYGSNRLGDLIRVLDDHFKEREFQVISRSKFSIDNPNVGVRDYLVACAIRGHYVRIHEDTVLIWVNKAVYELAQELDV